jgi:hypothetical protein
LSCDDLKSIVIKLPGETSVGAKACVISTLEDSNRDWNWTCFLQSKNVNHNKQDLLTHKIRKKGPCRAKHSMIAACQEEES